MKNYQITLFSLLLMSNVSWSANKLPKKISFDSIEFNRCAQFNFRYGLIIHVADIGWYAPDCSNKISLVDSGTKLVRFHYYKDVPAEFFKKSAEKYFNLNLESDDERTFFSKTLSSFNEGYVDISSNDYFDLLHWNNKILKLFKNNQLLVMSEHSAFAHKYFNIWFGENPVIKKLKKAFMPFNP